MEILSVGEKIRYFRKKYNIKQKDLCQNIMSPSMLSFLEKGKYDLNAEFAILLSDKINTYINNAEDKLTPQLLMESKEEQLNRHLKDAILKIGKKEIKKNEIESYISLFSQFEFTPQKIKAYTLISGYIIKNKIDYNTIPLLESALYNSANIPYYKFLLILILQLERVYLLENDFDSIIKLYYKTNAIIPENGKEILGHIYYNFALAFQRKNKTKFAITLYEKAKKYFVKESKLFFCINNLGICYFVEKNNDRALTLYLEVNSFNLSNYNKVMNYSNLLLCYIELNQKTSIKITKNKLKNLLCEISPDLRYQSYFSLGKAYIKLKDRYNAMLSFETEINLPFDLNNNHFFLEKYKESIIYLTKLYNMKDISKFKTLEKFIFQIPNELMDKAFILNILEIYLKVFGSGRCMDLIKRLRVETDELLDI